MTYYYYHCFHNSYYILYTFHQGLSGDMMSLDNNITFEDSHMRKIKKVQLERDKLNTTDEIHSLLPTCQQARKIADKYAKEIQDREKVNNTYTHTHTYIYIYIYIYVFIYVFLD